MKYSRKECEELFIEQASEAYEQGIVLDTGMRLVFDNWLDDVFEQHIESDTGTEYFTKRKDEV